MLLGAVFVVFAATIFDICVGLELKMVDDGVVMDIDEYLSIIYRFSDC